MKFDFTLVLTMATGWGFGFFLLLILSRLPAFQEQCLNLEIYFPWKQRICFLCLFSLEETWPLMLCLLIIFQRIIEVLILYRNYSFFSISFTGGIILKFCWLLFLWNENVLGASKYCIIFTNWRTPNRNRRLVKHFWDKNPWELYGIIFRQHF